MNIEQIEYIVNVAKTGSISATAETMHISQAGISKAIMKLEKEVGFELFRRTRHGTLPTERGKILIAKASEILLKVQEFEDEVSGQKEQIHGDIRLSVSPNFIAILPKAIMSFKASNPYVKLEITEKDSVEILEDIRQDITDMGLIYFHAEHSQHIKDLWLTTMVETRLIVCVGRKSVMASKSKLGIEDILDQTFVSVNGSFSRLFMKKLMLKYGPVQVLFTSTNQEVLKRTIAEGDVISIFMEFNIMNDPLILSGDIVAIPLEAKELDQEVIQLGYARSKRQHFSIAHQELLRHLQQEIERLGL
ncbi:LysR family transcriptional regulator [Paenibacillus sp. NPDC058177]|uniref:LysR family transcriptional regulator n=1 Tax=Paenibacillus sp. NPDC058177 TaxID=3346369 RepID=UPI0036DA1919